MVSIDDVQKKLTAYFDDRLIGQPELVEGIVTNIKLREIYHNNLAFAKETGIYIPPLNMLVRGKSGNGKSHSINFICRSLGLPFVSVNATDFTSSGYVGASLSDIPKMLIDEAERILKENDQNKVGFDMPPPTQDDKEIEEADNRFKAIEKELIDLGVRMDKMGPKRPAFAHSIRLYEKGISYRIRLCFRNKTPKKLYAELTEGKEFTDKERTKINSLLNKLSTPYKPYSFKFDTSFIDKFRLGGIKDSNPGVKEYAQNKGIVMIDEIDKILMGKNGQYNVGTHGIIREILAYLSGSNIMCGGDMFDTSNIIFICAGAFDMVDFKDIPTELLGRLPTRLTVKDPTEDSLYRMLTSQVVDPWGMVKLILRNKGCENFIIPNEVSKHIAESVINDEKIKPIGVRRLTAVISEIAKIYYLMDEIDKEITLSEFVADKALKTIRDGLLESV